MPSTTAIAMQDGYVGRIGPNAISRVAEALSAVEGAPNWSIASFGPPILSGI